MKAIRFTLFAIAMSALSGLTSCEKAVFDEDGSKTTEESQQETNHGDSTVSKVTLVLRVDVTRAVSDSLSWKTLQFEVFDSSNKSRAQIKQSVDDENCGTASVELAPGTYQVAVLAYSLTREPKFQFNPLRCDLFSKNDCSNVFYAYEKIDVGDKGQVVELTLKRANSSIRFRTKDVIPQEVKSMVFQYEGGSETLNFVNGYGYNKDVQTLSFSVVNSMIGKPMEIDLYTFKMSKNDSIKLTVSAYKSVLDANVKSLYKKVAYTIPVTHVGISDCSAYFFSDGSDDPEIHTGEGEENNGGNENTDGGTSFNVKVDTTWTGGVHYYQL